MNLLSDCAQKIQPQVLQWRRFLHAHPELSGQEFSTAAFVEQTLKGLGIEEVRRAGERGVAALIRGSEPGPVLGLRADMDALPVPELADVPFKSQSPGVMHACGHDIHTAILLGTARILQERRGELKGTVKLFFQPAEESGKGALEMIDAGELDHDRPDSMAALHVEPMIPAGHIGVRYGPFFAASNGFELKVTGKQGHGACPDLCVDPVAISAQVITALQQLVSRFRAPQNPAVITVGSIHGGFRGNIIAPDVVMQGTIRSLDPAVQAALKEAVPRTASLAAQALRGSVEFSATKGSPVLYNDEGVTARVESLAREFFGDGRVQIIPEATLGGEDFAFFADKVPSTMFRLGVGRADSENFPLHSSHFCADESAFSAGVAMMAGLALKNGR